MSVIGLDLGTSRVKAVRFDQDWQAVDSAAETTVVLRSAAGNSEQDMDSVWAAAARVVRAVAGRSPDPVAILALTAQGDGCWLVDDAGRPVRPAMLWNDSRSVAILDRWGADGRLDEAFRINGCYGAPGLAHAQLTWLADHEPDSLQRADRLLSCGSWIYQQLTGRRVLDVSDAANPFLDARTQHYSDRIIDIFELAGCSRLLPEVVSGADRLAPLLPEVCDLVGLPAGVPVALTPYDVVDTAVGVGALDLGQAFTVLGTTICVGLMSSDPGLDRVPNGMTLPGPGGDRWLRAYATLNGTEILDWTTSTLGLPDVSALMALAATATPGEQPLMLPYLSRAGERSPFRDSLIRGSFTGLNLGHSPADLARAAVDGLTLVVLDCLRAAGTPDHLALAGGGARSDLWCQAISDATGLPVTRPDLDEVGARGAVLTAAVDLGLVGSLAEAAEQAIRPGRQHQPDKSEHQRFADLYQKFCSQRDQTTSPD